MERFCSPCPRSYRYGEFAASAAVLNAGFNIDSLMLRYQGVDWRTKAFWKCNGMIDPRQEGSYDGASLNPLEVHLPTLFPHPTPLQPKRQP